MVLVRGVSKNRMAGEEGRVYALMWGCGETVGT